MVPGLSMQFHRALPLWCSSSQTESNENTEAGVNTEFDLNLMEQRLEREEPTTFKSKIENHNWHIKNSNETMRSSSMAARP